MLAENSVQSAHAWSAASPLGLQHPSLLSPAIVVQAQPMLVLGTILGPTFMRMPMRRNALSELHQWSSFNVGHASMSPVQLSAGPSLCILCAWYLSIMPQKWGRTCSCNEAHRHLSSSPVRTKLGKSRASPSLLSHFRHP